MVKLFSMTWWIPVGARLGGQRAEVRFQTADQEFSSTQGTLLGFYGIKIVFYACTIYPHQARTNAYDKMTVNDYIF